MDRFVLMKEFLGKKIVSVDFSIQSSPAWASRRVVKKVLTFHLEDEQGNQAPLYVEYRIEYDDWIPEPVDSGFYINGERVDESSCSSFCDFWFVEECADYD